MCPEVQFTLLRPHFGLLALSMAQFLVWGTVLSCATKINCNKYTTVCNTKI